jgi:hypothetical protein
VDRSVTFERRSRGRFDRDEIRESVSPLPTGFD